MFRWHHALMFLLAPLAIHGQESARKADEKQSPEKWQEDRSLSVRAAVAPVPALKYRLFPLSSERKDGNAVPIYLRLNQEWSDAMKKDFREKPEEWNKLALDKLPLAEAKVFIEKHAYTLRQFELGARRKTADWNYTLDEVSIVNILLPDAQKMRTYAPVLMLKARVEIAEGRYAEAVRTLETGFSFSQQIGESPFLITDLVGITIASHYVGESLLDLIERADSPNLYWALSVIPRPLFDQRRSTEFELNLLEMEFPELRDLERERTPAQWDTLLNKTRKGLTKFVVEMKGDKKDNEALDAVPDLPELTVAKKYLAEMSKIPQARIDAMSPSELRMRYILHYYHEVRDDLFKSCYLPFPEALAAMADTEERIKKRGDMTVVRLVKALIPTLQKVRFSQNRLERKLAMLRVIESLRMHAAATGEWPDKLDQVKVVPVPLDPGTDQPFEYQRDGKVATLSSRLPGENWKWAGLRYRITLLPEADELKLPRK